MHLILVLTMTLATETYDVGTRMLSGLYLQPYIPLHELLCFVAQHKCSVLTGANYNMQQKAEHEFLKDYAQL